MFIPDGFLDGFLDGFPDELSMMVCQMSYPFRSIPSSWIAIYHKAVESLCISFDSLPGWRLDDL